MKKFYSIVIMLLLVTIGVGLYYKQTYTKVDFNDEDVLDNARVFKYFSQEEFVIENIDDVDNNKYIIDPDTGEIIGTMPGNSEEESEMEILPADEAILKELETAEIVLIGKRVSDMQCVTGNCKQTIFVSEVKKGDKEIEGKNIEAYYFGGIANNIEIRVVSENNILIRDKEYLIFLNSTKHPGLYEIQNINGVGFFPLEEMKHEIVEDWEDVRYKDVKDYEFFVQDELSLKKLLEVKKKMMDKYIGE